MCGSGCYTEIHWCIFQRADGTERGTQICLEIDLLGEEICLEELDEDITEEEVKRAIGGLAQEKSPDLDSFIIVFYNKYWGIIKEDIVRLIIEIN